MVAATPPRLDMETLAAQYGYAAAFFNSSPELMSLIQQAVANQWTPDKFKAAFMNTNWYKVQNVAARQFRELEARDPTEARSQVNAQALKLQNMASKQGISLSQDRAMVMAHDTVYWGYNDEQLTQALAYEWHYQPNGGTSGNAATLETDLKKTAGDYGVTLSNDQIGQWVGGALAGKYDQNNFNDFIRDIARSKYPGMSQYIDQGLTVRQVASPYIQSYASILEKDPDTVQMTDPAIQKALQGMPPAPNGQPPQMQSVYDFEKGLRQDPRWLQTKNANQSMESAGGQILRDMGLFK